MRLPAPFRRSRHPVPLVAPGAVRALVTDLGGDVGLCERILDDFEADLGRRIRAAQRQGAGACADRDRARRELALTVDAFGATRLRQSLDRLSGEHADAESLSAAVAALEVVAARTVAALRLELAAQRPSTASDGASR
jgi:hypothetical protein